MKTSFLKISILALISIFTISCSKEDNSSSTNSEVIIDHTSTWVKHTVMNLQGVAKPGLRVMMFKSAVSGTSTLPPIEKEVISDANGLAYFDLTTTVTSDVAVKYYFEVFKTTTNGMTWESITHPNYDLKKGTMVTSSIIVN